LDFQEAIDKEKKKLETIEKLAAEDDKDTQADIDKEIDAAILAQEKSETFLSAEQKAERDQRSIFVGNIPTALRPKKIIKVKKKKTFSNVI
jgi:hypothetical protein